MRKFNISFTDAFILLYLGINSQKQAAKNIFIVGYTV